MDELLARLRALERRLGSVKSASIVIDEVNLDTQTLEVSVAGVPLTLSRREYMLLKALMESANKVQTRDMLDSKLYGWGEEVSRSTRRRCRPGSSRPPAPTRTASPSTRALSRTPAPTATSPPQI